MSDSDKDSREQVLQEDRLVAEALCEAGVMVTSSQDLLKTRERYPKAIPVLLEMLPKVQTYTLKEIIARSLGVREAKGKAEAGLIAAFDASLQDPGREAESLRWAIANTFEILGGGKGASASLLRLVTDPRSGGARGMLSLALAKTKNREAIPVLLKMLEEDDFTGFVVAGLGILGVEEAIPKLKLLAVSKGNAWIRREAKKALGRLGVDLQSEVGALPVAGRETVARSRKRAKPENAISGPIGSALEERLRVLAECGISLAHSVTPDSLTRLFSLALDEKEYYRDLLSVMGDEAEDGAQAAPSGYLSDNIWHFDTECIEGDGSYAAIAQRMVELAQGDLPLENIEDFVDLEEGEAWLSFSLDGKAYKWIAKVDADWVDPSIPPKFDELLVSRNAGRRFTYINLGGQDCLIGCATPKQRTALEARTGLEVFWLA